MIKYSYFYIYDIYVDYLSIDEYINNILIIYKYFTDSVNIILIDTNNCSVIILVIYNKYLL